jgi:hypothetical protein
MKTVFATLAFLALLSWGAACQADIIGNTLADDGDGVLTCNTYGFESIGPQEFKINIDGVHKKFATGDILGDILADSEVDPKLTLDHEIDNDTDRPWTDYHAVITMSKTFFIDNVTVANAGWTYVVSQPVLVGSDWVGTVDYYSGTPVAIGGTLDFAYRMTYLGSTSFHEELTPTSVGVPEPGTLMLLAGGLIGLVFARRKFAR